MRNEYQVKGMTCEHCGMAVRKEIGGLQGVAGVNVTLDTGIVTVQSDHLLDRDLVRAAVEEAGFELVDD